MKTIPQIIYNEKSFQALTTYVDVPILYIKQKHKALTVARGGLHSVLSTDLAMTNKI